MSSSGPARADFTIVVPASHPMLAGHFPGEPIVPGAWLLAAIGELAEHWLQSNGPPAEARRHIAGVRVVKFTRPVRPEQTCRVTFTNVAAGVRFALTHDDTACATGTLTLAGAAGSAA